MHSDHRRVFLRLFLRKETAKKCNPVWHVSLHTAAPRGSYTFPFAVVASGTTLRRTLLYCCTTIIPICNKEHTNIVHSTTRKVRPCRRRWDVEKRFRKVKPHNKDPFFASKRYRGHTTIAKRGQSTNIYTSIYENPCRRSLDTWRWLAGQHGDSKRWHWNPAE